MTKRIGPLLFDVALLVVSVMSCDRPQDMTFDIVHNPCEPLVVVPAEGSTLAERGNLAQAVELWNQAVSAQLTLDDLPDAPRLPVRFEDGALAIYGVYEDEEGKVLINRRLGGLAQVVTIAHELGHSFGLYHVAKSQRLSVMNKGNLVVAPNAGDVSDVRAIWGDCREGS
ncbi:MAG: hypothetical protein HY698_11680 [Deltaproteobacteria bacterium]|nr:hypothetical protein [Deltaproteobacteria bacterium]